MEQSIDLPSMLEARENRVRRQQELVREYRLPLVSFTLNIAGPVKNGPMLRRAFAAGHRALLDQLRSERVSIVFSEEKDEPTGCEGLYVVPLPPEKLKQITCWIEEESPLGRLFDMDVLNPSAEKLDRPRPRRCLLCDQPARICARNRTHSVEELQEATRAILREALNAQDACTAASLAVRALLYEVCVTPKPGLVDRADNGSHRDMDFYLFMNSAAVLMPYFESCVRKGRATANRPAPETLSAVRPYGKLAEAAMLRATGGVNTHKGAVYSMGLACAALGRLEPASWGDPGTVLNEIAGIAAGTVERELRSISSGSAVTAGQHAFTAYGVTGVRGEAEAGFPSVLEYGLPVLEDGLLAGKSPDEAGAAALLAILAHTPDTNMLSRGGPERWQNAVRSVRNLISQFPYPDQEQLAQMNREFVRENLSPGGSADLLALCWFLHFLREESDSWKQ